MLVSDKKNIIPSHDCSYWYLDTDVGSIYTTFSLNKILVPKLNFEVITTNLQLYRDVSTLSQSEVDKIKPFLFTDSYNDTIKG